MICKWSTIQGYKYCFLFLLFLFGGEGGCFLCLYIFAQVKPCSLIQRYKYCCLFYFSTDKFLFQTGLSIKKCNLAHLHLIYCTFNLRRDPCSSSLSLISNSASSYLTRPSFRVPVVFFCHLSCCIAAFLSNFSSLSFISALIFFNLTKDEVSLKYMDCYS